LEVRRQGLLNAAQFVAGSGGVLRREPLAIFQTLEQQVADFIEVVRAHYSRFPLRDLLLSVDTLKGCTEAFARAGTDERRAEALDACRRGAALIAGDLTTPLPVPDILGEPLAPPSAEEPEEEEEGGVTSETIDAVEERWQAVADRISGWEKPNSVNAAKFLDRFVEEFSADESLGIEEDDLDSLIGPVREMLEEYVELDPESETYSEDRAAAWQEFVDSLGNVDFSDLGQV
jgi:hypothetical protein